MKKVWFAVGIAVAVMLALWAIGWVAITRYIPLWEQRGQFGDMFGAVNALFSSLALVGVIAAILIQREELELQRMELEMTRIELAKSADAQERSSNTMKVQAENMILTSKINVISALQEGLKADFPRIVAALGASISTEEQIKFKADRDKNLKMQSLLGEELVRIAVELDSKVFGETFHVQSRQ